MRSPRLVFKVGKRGWVSIGASGIAFGGFLKRLGRR